MKPLRVYSVKLGEDRFVDVALFPSEVPEEGSFIKLILYKQGKRLSNFMKKDKAALLASLLQLLIQEGARHDYELLKEKYPEQQSWHIR